MITVCSRRDGSFAPAGRGTHRGAAIRSAAGVGAPQLMTRSGQTASFALDVRRLAAKPLWRMRSRCLTFSGHIQE